MVALPLAGMDRENSPQYPQPSLFAARCWSEFTLVQAVSPGGDAGVLWLAESGQDDLDACIAESLHHGRISRRVSDQNVDLRGQANPGEGRPAEFG